jgi:16S rRNA processing protein RimM
MKISVAYIKKPRGFRGELAVIPYRPNTQSLRPGIEVTLQKDNSGQNCVIESVKFIHDRIAIKLIGIDDDKAAQFWQGGEVLIEEKDLVGLEDGEYYHYQLEGCEVFEENGERLGKVRGIDYLSANDVLSVIGDGGEILIPLIKQVVISVDVKNKRIVIRKLEGLY